MTRLLVVDVKPLCTDVIDLQCGAGHAPSRWIDLPPSSGPRLPDLSMIAGVKLPAVSVLVRRRTRPGT